MGGPPHATLKNLIPPLGLDRIPIQAKQITG